MSLSLAAAEPFVMTCTPVVVVGASRYCCRYAVAAGATKRYHEPHYIDTIQPAVATPTYMVRHI